MEKVQKVSLLEPKENATQSICLTKADHNLAEKNPFKSHRERKFLVGYIIQWVGPYDVFLLVRNIVKRKANFNMIILISNSSNLAVFIRISEVVMELRFTLLLSLYFLIQ